MRGGRTATHAARRDSLTAFEFRTGGAGLMLGVSRESAPVTVQAFRAEPTSLVMVGGPRLAQLLTLRAVGSGAAVTVETSRPSLWTPLVQLVAGSADAIAVVPPGGMPSGTGSSYRPHLTVVDIGPGAPVAATQHAPWQTRLLLRDDLSPWDTELLVHADVAVLQPLTAAEAAIAVQAVGLRSIQPWLSRLRSDMVTVISQGVATWAMITQTPFERQLIGAPDR